MISSLKHGAWGEKMNDIEMDTLHMMLKRAEKLVASNEKEDVEELEGLIQKIMALTEKWKV